MKNMPWRKIPLGRMVTIFCFVMLGVAGVLIMTDSSRAQDKIEVQYSSDKTHEITMNDGRETEVGYSQMDKQTSAEIVAEQSCEYANVHCAQGEMNTTAKVNTLLTALITYHKQGAEVEGESTADSSVMSFLVKGIATTYTPPASGVYYVADAIDHLGISNKAYAQGFGFYGLQPFLVTWKIMRNFAYMIFAVIIIGVAISILVRQTFSSKNALTIQQVLPNIVIALIAITFSYAIAGFLIDLMYWIMYAVGSFVQINTSAGSDANANDILGSSIWGVAGTALMNGMGSTFSGVNAMIDATMGDSGLMGMLGNLIGGVAGSIAALVMAIVIIVTIFKLFIILAKSYVYVIMYTIFSPFFLAMQVFNSGAFKKWVLSIAANLSPFVLTFFMLLLQGIVQHIFVNSGQSGWVPPFMVGGGERLDGSGVGAIIVLGMILSMNEIITETKKKIGGSGGFFEQMGGAAQANAKKAWNGAPGKFGRSVAGGGLRTLGGAIGGAIGGARNGGGFKGALSGAKTGAYDVGIRPTVAKAQRDLLASKAGQVVLNAPGGDYVRWHMIKKKADHLKNFVGQQPNQYGLISGTNYGDVPIATVQDAARWSSNYDLYRKWINRKEKNDAFSGYDTL